MPVSRPLVTLLTDFGTADGYVGEVKGALLAAVMLGSLASRIRRTGRIVTTDFAIVLTAVNGEIVRFQILEDSFAVSQAARG